MYAGLTPGRASLLHQTSRCCAPGLHSPVRSDSRPGLSLQQEALRSEGGSGRAGLVPPLHCQASAGSVGHTVPCLGSPCLRSSSRGLDGGRSVHRAQEEILQCRPCEPGEGLRGEGRDSDGCGRVSVHTFFSYTSCHTMLAKKRCCMISLASSEPPPSLREHGRCCHQPGSGPGPPPGAPPAGGLHAVGGSAGGAQCEGDRTVLGRCGWCSPSGGLRTAPCQGPCPGSCRTLGKTDAAGMEGVSHLPSK